MTEVKPLFSTPILMILVMVLASAIVPYTIDNQEYTLTDSEQASSSSRVTGNESVSVWGYSSTYTAGSIVSVNISASNLDSNTNYTLEWGARDQMGGWWLPNSVNITNVTSYSTSHSWTTVNSTNNSQQNLWNSTWKIEFSLTASNSTLFSDQTTMFVVGSAGTLILYPSSSTYATNSSISSSVYAIGCYYNVANRLEYDWTSPNGTVILSGGQNFTGSTKYLTSSLPSSATGTPGTYTHTGRLYQQGTLIKTLSTLMYVVAPGTGYEVVYLSSQPSSYMAGDTVSANITAMNLNPNTTYTLEWEGISAGYSSGISPNPAGSVNITNVTYYFTTHSWSTVNASNSTQQILYNNSWRIQANLYASNLTLTTNQTTTFAVGTGGMLSVSTPASTYLTGSSFYPSVYATSCFYDISNRIEYQWIDPTGNVLLTNTQNFTGTSQSLGFNVPSSATSTAGVYTLVGKLFQQGSLIVQNSVNVNIISTPGTGAEMVYANVQYSTYIVGSTVWADIYATNLDPNTNYTLEWAPIPVSWSGFYSWYATDSTSITNVSNYSASHSWSTGNSGNSNTLAADTWKIYAELSSSTILLSSGTSNNFTIQNSTSQPFDIDVNAYGGIGTTGFNTLHVYNAVAGETHSVYMNLTDSSGYMIDYNQFYWTANQSNFSWNQYWNGLSPDNYCVYAVISSLNSSNNYDSDSDCFQMTAPPPVNNTLSVEVNAYGSVGTTGSSTLHAWNATVGETHWVNQSLTDINGNVLDNAGFYWIANQSNMSWSYSWSGLLPGNYCVQGHVVSLNSSNGDSDTDCFQITSPPTPPSIFVYAAANSAPNSASGVIYASSGQASTLYNVNWTLFYSSGSLIDYGMMQYYGGGVNTSWSLNWTGLLPGFYCLEANIFLNISLIDSDSQCFTIQNVPITGTVNVSLPSYTYSENDPFVVAIYAGNLNPSTLYTVTWNLIDQNVVIPTYSGSYNFSGMTYDYSAQTFSGLSHGTYWIGADLWDSSGNVVDSHNFTFIVAPAAISGCIDPLATNFNINATVDDGSCVYPPPSTNTPPVCSINIGSINSNSTTLSYSHQIQLSAGNHYIITSCIDLDGDAMMLTMTNSSASLTASGTGNVSVGMWVNVPTNFTGSVTISVSWTDGNYLSSSILDIQILGGGATGGNSSGNSGGSGSSGGSGGSLPGFTGLLTMASLAGIAILRPKRRD